MLAPSPSLLPGCKRFITTVSLFSAVLLSIRKMCCYGFLINESAPSRSRRSNWFASNRQVVLEGSQDKSFALARADRRTKAGREDNTRCCYRSGTSIDWLKLIIFGRAEITHLAVYPRLESFTKLHFKHRSFPAFRTPQKFLKCKIFPKFTLRDSSRKNRQKRWNDSIKGDWYLLFAKAK